MRFKTKINYFVLLCIFFSGVGYASDEWVSDIDKKYININYDLYTKTMEAKRLISKWNGESELLEEASTLLGEVMNEDPDFAPAYVQIARLYSSLGHQAGNKISKDALEAMEKYLIIALEKEPNYGYAYTMMGFTKMKAGQLDKAENYYVKAEKTGTKYPYLKSQKAELLLKKGMPQEAIELASEGYYENISRPEVAAGYATIIIYATFKINNSADQQELWQKRRIELQPDVAWNLGDYSRFLLYVRHDYDAAIEYAEKALEIMDYGMGRMYLALANYGKWEELDNMTGKKDEARSHFMKAQLIYPDTDYLLTNIGKNRKFMKTYFKLLNYNIKAKNAKQDLGAGLITKQEYEQLILAP